MRESLAPGPLSDCHPPPDPFQKRQQGQLNFLWAHPLCHWPIAQLPGYPALQTQAGALVQCLFPRRPGRPVRMC